MTRRPGAMSFATALATLLAVAAPGATMAEDAERAQALAREALLVDTHIDVPYRLEEGWSDVTRRTETGDIDYERACAGGLDVPFMSIYTPGESKAAGAAFELANRLIDRVEALAGRAPERLALAASADRAEQVARSGRIALAMGMENGSPLQGRLENVTFFRQRGVSYITLAHSLSNHVSDSFYDEQKPWNDLSPFGREVVAEMNRVGMMIDVSHLSDAAFWQVLELSRAPVIASHSSARHFTPGWERNISDEMIRALAAKGGVIMINFGSSFLTDEARRWYDAMSVERKEYLERNGLDEHGEAAAEFGRRYREEHPFPFATLDDAFAHFQHVIGLVGVRHVGLGSDFDGVGDSLPEGLKDVSAYPRLVAKFIEAGYGDDDIRAILGGNLVRVWREVESLAGQG